MSAYELAIQNFTVAEHLLQLHENKHLLLPSRSATSKSQAMPLPDDMNFLLRQAVIVACAAVDNYFWDVVSEKVPTIVRAMHQRDDDYLLYFLTLSVQDYLATEKCADPDDRLRQVVLRCVEHGAFGGGVA